MAADALLSQWVQGRQGWGGMGGKVGEIFFPFSSQEFSI